jgi:hypothetical protein
MADTPVIGYGSKLRIETSPGVFAEIARVQDIDGADQKGNSVDVTSLDSPDNREEKIPGMINPGTMKFGVVYGKTEYARLLANFMLLKNFQYELTDGSMEEFQGFIVSMGKKAPVKDKIMAEIELEITGVITFTPAP